MRKRYHAGQSRKGNPERRALEFAVIVNQVKRNKERFIRRLSRRLVKEGECYVFKGTRDGNGYARLNFRHVGGRHVTIHAQRVFLILATGAPIPEGYEAGHAKFCKNRACVRHVALEHYKSNASTNKGKG